jgi:hypothetical protein
MTHTHLAKNPTWSQNKIKPKERKQMTETTKQPIKNIAAWYKLE